jgi:hypothetical protein
MKDDAKQKKIRLVQFFSAGGVLRGMQSKLVQVPTYLTA